MATVAEISKADAAAGYHRREADKIDRERLPRLAEQAGRARQALADIEAQTAAAMEERDGHLAAAEAAERRAESLRSEPVDDGPPHIAGASAGANDATVVTEG